MAIVSILKNSRRRRCRTPQPTHEPLSFHSKLPGYTPSPLVELPEIARRLGAKQLLVKDESQRLGLPSFKIMGAAWAIYRLLEQRLGHPFAPWRRLDELACQVAACGELTLVAATDGNHGRAVARMASLIGLSARILVPRDMASSRIAAIREEGADIVVVDGTYDDAVQESANAADDTHVVVSDTSWDGYHEVPGWIVEGYSTLFWEIEDQIAKSGSSQPDLVVVQMGVGSLAAAAVQHYRRSGLREVPTLVGVEPSGADCIRASVDVGSAVTLPGPHLSMMAGLNCGTPSMLALPLLRAGVDLFVTISDESACDAMRGLAAAGIASGPTGAAGLGALLAASASHADLSVTGRSVLVLSTEGATDPAEYAAVVGSSGSNASLMSAVGNPRE